MSDKVASGSDDGNFFVWNKVTGKLDGIWEGDGSIVNGKSATCRLHPGLYANAFSDGATSDTTSHSCQWYR